MIMEKKDIKIAFSAKLNEQDIEDQTYGCRANNPNICSNHFLEDVCAFVTEDNICRKPSRAWKKKYYELKGRVDNE